MYFCSVFLFGSVSNIRPVWPLGTPYRFIVDYSCVCCLGICFLAPGWGTTWWLPNLGSKPLTVVLNHYWLLYWHQLTQGKKKKKNPINWQISRNNGISFAYSSWYQLSTFFLFFFLASADAIIIINSGLEPQSMVYNQMFGNHHVVPQPVAKKQMPKQQTEGKYETLQ